MSKENTENKEYIKGFRTRADGKREVIYYATNVTPSKDKNNAMNEIVVDTANYLPTSRAESGRIGVPQYDFKDGKDTGDRTRLRMTDKSLDITEADELLKSMKRDIENKQKAEERAKAEKKLNEMKAKVEQRTNEILGITNTAESE